MSMTWEAYGLSPEDLERVKAQPSFFSEVTDYQNSAVPSYSLEKAWHGLHYLLNDGRAWEGTPPLNFIVAGGTEVPGSDGGYGSARAYTPDETRRIQQALSQVTGEQLWSHFDADKMSNQGVYPEIWDEPEDELRSEYTDYLQGMQEFVAATASNGHGLLVWLA